ncbi:MAG: molybdopterin synthase sulfur carrier subunit [Tepidiforma sp.]|jgi:molybdopterin converting factor subunit 1|uniref:Molybdopterin synthase sulfur carrier subunit n=1 Tax=Tepidiforma bonchosmolovskayae TaxID=2601677 RepID=A0ABX6C2G9_9CHLR|nr:MULTISPECIES: molybdopterin converting factor subunit 1 [Tepidiforma]QFG03427.1 molybdopterin converting factor subunit 1 [Tepidiforma bonchosmolovskayae]GIW16680.1 MAG: molybdopterin synthase sulfur carrier subunit [Tepidiforma sp.]
MGSVTVLLFASLAERAGTRRLEVEVGEGELVRDVRDRVVARYPQLAAAVPTLMYALDEEYAREDAPVRAGATLALIPPVSGG